MSVAADMGLPAGTIKALMSCAVMTLFLQSCFRAQQSFLTVQLCLGDQRGVEHLKRIMYDVAKSQKIEFIDNSRDQAQDLKTMGSYNSVGLDPSLAIDFHLEGKAGLGVTATNLGLPPYQVALGFTEGADAAQARRLSSQLIEALSRRWQVEKVPQGSGVFPMKTCGG